MFYSFTTCNKYTETKDIEILLKCFMIRCTSRKNGQTRNDCFISWDNLSGFNLELLVKHFAEGQFELYCSIFFPDSLHYKIYYNEWYRNVCFAYKSRKKLPWLNNIQYDNRSLVFYIQWAWKQPTVTCNKEICFHNLIWRT